MTSIRPLLAGLSFLAAAALLPPTLPAADKDKNGGKTDCRMSFELKSWSVFYKSGKGKGTITCDNGQSAPVKIRTHGGGVSCNFGRIRGIGGEAAPEVDLP